MTNAIIESIVSRSTTKYYDPAAVLSDDQIRELVRIGTTAPTSFHLQNWRFIAVRTPEAKARLRPIAWGQPMVTDAAVTFIICGQLADPSVIPKRLAPVVEAGIMPAEMVPDWENATRRLYFEQPQRQRHFDGVPSPRATTLHGVPSTRNTPPESSTAHPRSPRGTSTDAPSHSRPVASSTDSTGFSSGRERRLRDDMYSAAASSSPSARIDSSRGRGGEPATTFMSRSHRRCSGPGPDIRHSSHSPPHPSEISTGERGPAEKAPS